MFPAQQFVLKTLNKLSDDKLGGADHQVNVVFMRVGRFSPLFYLGTAKPAAMLKEGSLTMHHSV